MFEGPAPADLTEETWRGTRAGFIANVLDIALEGALRYLKACDDALRASLRHDEVIIWLDYRLSDQLILIRVLDWCSRQDLGGGDWMVHFPGGSSGGGTIVDFVPMKTLTIPALAPDRFPAVRAQKTTAHFEFEDHGQETRVRPVRQRASGLFHYLRGVRGVMRW